MVYHFGVPHPTVKKSSGCKRGLLESWWAVGRRPHVGICLENCKYYNITPDVSICTFPYDVYHKNKNQFTVNSEIHSINTKQHTNLHQPTSNLTGYQQGIYYSGARVYNNLPPHIKQLSDDSKNFVLQMKKFLYLHSFYSLEEYFQY